MSREQKLQSIGEMLVNGHTMTKLDFLGTIRVYGQYYFNVFRRYNNVYEIVLEDFAGDFHFLRDYTVRESMQKVLCLSDEQMKDLYIIDAHSFKHHSNDIDDVTGMRWTEIQHRWYGVDMNLGGIHQDFHKVVKYELKEEKPSAQHSQPLVQHLQPLVQHSQPSVQQEQVTQESEEDSVDTPPPLEVDEMDDSNRFTPLWTGVNLSERFAQADHLQEEEFTILRNGTRIAKPRR